MVLTISVLPDITIAYCIYSKSFIQYCHCQGELARVETSVVKYPNSVEHGMLLVLQLERQRVLQSPHPLHLAVLQAEELGRQQLLPPPTP